jgi:phosphoglycerate kinase
VADRFDEGAESRIVPVEEIPEGWMALDIGRETIKLYKEALDKANTILWFGPIGVFEMDRFAVGTKEIAQAVADNRGVTIIGGGDSSNAINSLGLSEKMTLVSTGGGASLTLAQGRKLVAVEAMD